MNEWQKVVLNESEIVACSGRLEGPLGAMCMALNNGMNATVCVDVLSAVTIVATLKAMFPGCDTPPGGGGAVKTQLESGFVGVQAGHQSAPD